MKSILSFLFFLFTFFIGLSQPTQPILRPNSTMHTYSINCICVDKQEKYVLTCSNDKTAKLWNAANGEFIRNLYIPIALDADAMSTEGRIFACALSPDGKVAAIGGFTGYEWDKSFSVYLFNTSTGEMVNRITNIGAYITKIEFSKDGRFLAVGTLASAGLYIYELPSTISLLEKHPKLTSYKQLRDDIAFYVKFDFDTLGNLVTMFNAGMNLYDKKFEKIKSKNTFKLLGDLSYSPNGIKIAITTTDHDIQIRDGKTVKKINQANLPKSLNNFQSVIAFSLDGKKIYSNGSFADQIRVWDSLLVNFKDFDVSNSYITSIYPLKNGVVFAGDYPEFGRMNEDGTLRYYIQGEINNLKNPDRKHLKVNQKADEISFTPSGKSTLYFSVKGKLLTTNPSNFNTQKTFSDNYKGIRVAGWRDSTAQVVNGKPFRFKQFGEICMCVDIAPDASSIVFGTQLSIYCMDLQANKKWRILTPAWPIDLNISGDNRTLVATFADGTISWYRMSDGALLLTLFAHPDNKRWILYGSNGYYTCSMGGDELIGWHINNGPDKAASFYPAKNYADKFYRPDIIAEVLEACETDLEILGRKNEEIANISKLPPVVKIVTPESNTVINSSQATITVDITDQGGGVDEVLLYLNGKLVETTQRGFKPVVQNNLKQTKTFNITLTNGENIIKATAFNNDRTEAIADEIKVTYEGTKATSNLYLFVIGINEYKNPKYKLNYAVADASSFKDELKKGTSGIFGKVETIFIQDVNATKTAIIDNFNKLKAKVKQEDVFIFYYAGHGVMSEDKNPQFYIVPYDVTQLYGSNIEMTKTAIPASELQAFSKDLKAQKQLFIFDACQSGGMVEMLASRGAIEERAIAQLARSTGTYWITASGSQQFASEFKTLGHGLFTYTVLQGLQGNADGSNDKKITVEELSTYIKNKLPEFSEKYKGEAQYPNSFGYGNDFPILILNK